MRNITGVSNTNDVETTFNYRYNIISYGIKFDANHNQLM